MSTKTGISWTNATWNPIRGCSRVSEGCRHCYAETMARRFAGPGQPYEGLVESRLRVISDDEQRIEARWTGVVRFVAEHLADPLRWTKPRLVFVNSMSDLFHERLTNEQIAAIFGVMAACPQHTFQVLTKRAKRMREWFSWAAEHGAIDVCLREAWQHLSDPEGPSAIDAALERTTRNGRPTTWPLPNVWLGVSVENQDSHDERAEDLLACPAAVYFFSIEPMLSPVDASQSLRRMLRTRDGRLLRNDHPDAQRVSGTWRRHIDWVIAGCESGHGARPCSVDWLRSIRDQCAAAGVPFWLKQAVGHRGIVDADVVSVTSGPGSKRKRGGVIDLPYLDGVQHIAMPAVTR